MTCTGRNSHDRRVDSSALSVVAQHAWQGTGSPEGAGAGPGPGPGDLDSLGEVNMLVIRA